MWPVTLQCHVLKFPVLAFIHGFVVRDLPGVNGGRSRTNRCYPNI
jgi:hypothetical protein